MAGVKEANDEMWEQRFQEMVAYKKKNGHLFLYRKSHPHERALGSWVGRQRCFYRRNLLQLDRVEKLNSVNFPWIAETFQYMQWRKTYAQLVEEFESNGFVNFTKVPNQWAKTQRRLYREGRLDQEKIDLLEKINFVWRIPNASRTKFDDSDHHSIDVGETTWKARFKQLLEHKKIFGHCVVDKAYDAKLSEWVSYQRFFWRRNKLLQSKIDMLQSIGFEWHLEKRRRYSHGERRQTNLQHCQTGFSLSHGGVRNNAEIKKNDCKDCSSYFTQDTRNRFIQIKANINKDDKRESETSFAQGDIPLVPQSCADNVRYEKQKKKSSLDDIVSARERSRPPKEDIRSQQPKGASEGLDNIYPVGTQLLSFFPGHGWKKGSIQAIDNRLFIVQFEGNEDEEYIFEETSIHSFVEFARLCSQVLHSHNHDQESPEAADKCHATIDLIKCSIDYTGEQCGNSDCFKIGGKFEEPGFQTEAEAGTFHHDSCSSQEAVTAEVMTALTKPSKNLTFRCFQLQMSEHERQRGSSRCKTKKLGFESNTNDEENVEPNQFLKDSVGFKVWNALKDKVKKKK